MSLYPFTVDFSEASPENIDRLIEIVNKISYNELFLNPSSRKGRFFLDVKEIPPNITFPSDCHVRPGDWDL